MNWFGDSLLKAHVMYVSPEWAPHRGERFDARRLTSILSSAGISALELYCKDIHGYAYHPTRVREGAAYPVDVAGQLLEACHQDGMRFIAYYSVGWDERAAAAHEDWVVRGSDGSVPMSELRLPFLCINTGYRAFALAGIQELIDQYAIDGIFIDIFMDNIPTACYCATCDELFQAIHGTTVPRTFDDPEQVVNVRRFQVESYEGFLAEVRERMRSRHPEALMTYNFVGGISAHTHTFTSLVDWYEVEAHAPDFLHQSRTARILRSQGKPFEIMSPGCTKSIREGGSMIAEVMGDWMSMVPKPLAAIKTEAAVALANGGTLTLGVNPRPDGSIDEAGLEPMVQLGKWIGERATSFRGSTPLSDAAILWNEASYAAASLELFDRVELLSGDKSTQGLHAALVGAHVQFDILPAEHMTWRERTTVILPEGFVTEPELEAELRRYVASGGNLIVLYRAGLTDESGRQRSDFALADVMGVDSVGEHEDDTWFIRVEDPLLQAGLLDTPMLMRGRGLLVQPTTASVAARFVAQVAPRTSEHYVWPTAYNPPGDVAGSPAVTYNQHGAGTCVYVAFPLAANVASRGTLDPNPRQLLANIVARALPTPFLRTNAPHQVEVVANQRGAEVIVHLINYYIAIDGHYCLDDRLPGIGDLALEVDRTRLPGQGAIEATLGDGSPIVVESGSDPWVRMTLPTLRDHLAIHLRSAGT